MTKNNMREKIKKINGEKQEETDSLGSFHGFITTGGRFFFRRA
jgi:hypothetical protein